MTDAEMNSLIASARDRAARVGPMHGMWDTIFDAEAMVDGKETLSNWGSGDKARKTIAASLMRFIR